MTMIPFGLYLVALLCVIVTAGVGMDFSPSFTAMFLQAFVTLTALVELCNYLKEKKCEYVFSVLKYLCSIVGAVLVMISVFIYAFGDDLLMVWVRVALIASVVLHFVIYVLLYRKQHRKMGIGAGIENWLLLGAGIFTLSCAISSAALWPYGFGVLLILTAKRFGDIRTDSWFPRVIMILGMFLCAVFLVAPMVF